MSIQFRNSPALSLQYSFASVFPRGLFNRLLRNVALAPMLVTHSGPRLPSALCIQHGAVAPRGEGGWKTGGGSDGVRERDKEPKKGKSKACYGHRTKHHLLYPEHTHTEKCPQRYKRLNLRRGLCVHVCVRETNRPVYVTGREEIQLPFT